MGKIIAMGGGFGDDCAWDLAEYVIRLTGKEHPNYLQIPTAGYDFADGGSIAVFAKSGCETDILCVSRDGATEDVIAKKVRAADMIYVPGGNLEFLMRHWNRSGLSKYLKEAFDDGKVLFGSSSGSMCWFRQGFDDCGKRNDWMFVDCLDLIPYCNVPHYDSGGWQEYNGFADKTPLSSICCENEAALVYIDGKYSVLSSARKPDATAYLFDANNGYKRYDLKEHPELLEKL